MKHNENKLPIKVKTGYGVAEIGTSAVEVMMRLYLLIFYTDVAGLQPHLAGYAVALGIVWDAITDPLIGIISDRTRSSYGKRRPYILAGGMLLPIMLLLIFNPPAIESQAGKFLFLLISYISLNSAMTILAIPHISLAGELSSKPHEKTELFGWRFFFGNIGALLATMLNIPRYIAGVIFATSLITYVATKGRDIAANGESPAFPKMRTELQSLGKNKAFILLFFAYVIATIGLSLNSAIAIFYYKYRLELNDQQIRYIIGLFILVISISIVGWVMISKRFGKKWPPFYGILFLAIMTIFGYPFFPVRNIYPPLFAAVFGGIMAGATVLLDSMVADVAEYDRKQTGKHKEGLYFGVWRMGAKISRAISIILCGIWLKFISFVPNSVQTPEVSEKLAWMFGPGVGIFLLLAIIIFSFVPYKKMAHSN